ncbi:MAG: leucine-rich repeat domain-containing protein [Prevotella nanceiensis]|nr:leucine-rich repeat domain-containing protein [Hoylesella nanceiensis]
MKQLYLLLITLLVSLSAYAEKSGTCGANLQWKLTDEGVLTITGTGEMQDWNRSKPSPWHADKSVKQVIIGNGVTTIGSSAFSDCDSLTSVTIPNSVTTIGYYAFSGCKNVKQITSEAVTPPDCSRYAFDGVNRNECKLFVPKNSIDAYKKADVWRNFFLIEGTTTGIINNIYNKTENVDVYTIDGIKRLSKASVNEINALPKGVYIVNGKKIVIK